MKFEYLNQPPRSYTFEQPRLRKFVENHCIGLTLNIFGGKIRLNVNEVSNDIDTSMPTDYHVDARQFIREWKGEKFNTVILDPPYNWRKAKEKYGSRMIGEYPLLKNELVSIITNNARIITLGYDTVGMSKSRGFRKIALCVVCHGGDHHDTLCLVEERIHRKSLFEVL